MICSQCGKKTEKEDNIIPLCCPFCQNPYENQDESPVIKKKTKIFHISPFKPVTDKPETMEEMFQNLLKEAEAGEEEAFFPVATAYFYGKGVTQNYKLAFEYYLKSAECGDIDGIFKTGMAYFQGVGVEMDFEKAFVYFRQASQENHPKGHIMLGICYTSAFSKHLDPVQGVKLLEKGAQHEPDSASVALAICYSQGIGVETDIKKAIHWLNVGVEHENEVAMYHMASWLIQGEYLPQDYAKAIPLLEKSSELQCPEACYLLAQCYFCGAGMLENWSLGIRYTRRGDQILQRRTDHIDQLDFLVHPLFLPGFGIPELEAMVEAGTSLYIHYSLGVLYEKAGQIDRAIDVFHQCEEENLPQALYKLGEYYENLGVDSLDKGVAYYEKSAKSHYAPALCALGRCYEEGISLQKNPQFAYFYYHQSSIQNYPPGNFHVGLCHRHGVSIPVNEKKAQQYFQRSYQDGFYQAKEFLEKE